MEEAQQTDLSWIWTLVGLIAIVGILWWVGSSIYNKHLMGEKPPFWRGTELVQVCKTPYYSSQDCFKSNVTLIDKKTAQIHFPDGGYKYTEDVTCWFAGQSFPDEPRYVFCRSWDSEGQQWDFMPAWVNYPSIEDLSRNLEKYKK